METQIPGFFLYPDFIGVQLERELLTEIDDQVWAIDYHRRLQYYGFRNELEAPYNLIPFPITIPPVIYRLSEEVVSRGLLTHQPDQVIINEYLPGGGIKPHKDRAYYENQICGVNLGSGCVMRFIKGANLEVVDIEVPRRSLYIMQDDARKKWNHSIPPRKKDKIDGQFQHRQRRVSITYRKVKPTRVKPIDPEGKVAQILKDKFNIFQ